MSISTHLRSYFQYRNNCTLKETVYSKVMMAIITIIYIVMYVPFCSYCYVCSFLCHCFGVLFLCVNVYCTTATGCQPNCS
jgi:hypothetical protein